MRQQGSMMQAYTRRDTELCAFSAETNWHLVIREVQTAVLTDSSRWGIDGD